MSDPYKVLNVSRDATDAQIKEAYREMAKKYHPDNYAGSPIADLAGEKMKEINEAYDRIMEERRSRNSGGYQTGRAGAYNPSSEYNDVRSLIAANRIADAEQILNGVPTERRNAEWYFLKGSILYKRGWLEEAFNHFTKACQMDPNNMEYRAAMNAAQGRRSGNYGPYNGYGGYNPNMNRGANACDICSGLICADCCCECMGGDLISCC
jgi:molecular chaperone DnaJ